MSEEVELTYGELTPATLAGLMECPEIVKSLDLSGNNIDGAYCKELAETLFSKMCNLESLDMKDNSIGPDGATRLFEVLRDKCPHLRYLDVNENAIQDEAMFALAVLVRDSELQTLNVVTNHITPRGLPTLCDGIVASESLAELSLAFNVLGDEGAGIVADMLGGHPSLTVLDLSDNGIGDEGAVALATALMLDRRSCLRQLDLSVNHIGDIGFQALGEALAAKGGNPHFVHLDVGCNDAVEEAGRSSMIGYLAHAQYLQSVDLTSCNLSDADAHGLVLALRSRGSSLRTVEWYNNPRMTLAAEKELYDAIQAKSGADDGSGNDAKLSGLNTANAAVAAVGIATVVLAVATMHRRRQVA